MHFFAPSHHHAQSALKAPKAKGFSLVEVMMQLVILSIVTVPMLMLMQMQKHNLVQSRENLMNQLMADQLFDNTMVPYETPVGPFTSGGQSFYFSSKCDPIQHDKTDDEYRKTCCWARVLSLPAGPVFDAAYATCPQANHAYNRDMWQGPFFTRSYDLTPDGRGLRTTISLYRSVEVDAANQPYFSATRTVNLDATNFDYSSSYNIASGLTPSEYSQRMLIDEEGTLWEPAAWSGGIPGRTNSNPALPAPFRAFISMAPRIWGRILPNTSYVLNAYFVSPATVTTGCINHSSQVSCSLVSLRVSSSTYSMSDANVGDTSNTAYNSSLTRLATVNNMDVAALGNVGEDGHKPVMITVPFKTPPNANSYLIQVISPTPDTGTNIVQLSGLSIIRQREQ